VSKQAAEPLSRRLPRVLGVVGLGLALLFLSVRFLPHAPLASRAPLSRAVYARGGELLRMTLAEDEQYRLWTPLAAISPLSVRATLTYEDRYFRFHPGTNPISLVRAVRSLFGGGRRVGGSTITMQLARRLYDIDSRRVTGKLKQILAALWLEARYSKDEILEAYLNLAPFGGNLEGIGAASLSLFGKPPSRLSLPEAVSLALLPQNPNQRLQALRAAKPEFARMREALGRRLIARWPEIGDASLATLAANVRKDELPFLAPHFTDQILADSPDDNRIKTTLDLPLQRLLERQVASFVERRKPVGVNNAAAMLVDARDMGVRALVGSADFFSDEILGQVNGTRARRSPGSALKPFVYALGMEQGVIHPRSILKDAPVAFSAYSPENFDGRYAGPLTATDALVRSRNIPALLVAAKLDRPTLYQFLTGAGVDLPQPESYYGLGLVLGTGEVTMEEIATLYAALANHGQLRPLRRYDKDSSAAPVHVLSEEASWLVLEMLAQNPRPTDPRLPTTDTMALPWKTGTSWGFRDAWSVGLVGPYVLAVWVGDFTGRSNPEFVGIKTAAPLFFATVDALAAHDRGLAKAAAWPWPRPKGVVKVDVCSESGQIPGPHCPHARPTWFIAGRSPTSHCDVHRSFAIDDRSGRRTCEAAPHGPTHDEVFEVWPTDMLKLWAAAGLPRRTPPAAAPGCPAEQSVPGAPPRITSPLNGVAYTLRPGKSNDTLAFLAETDGDAHEVFWYLGRRFAGKSASGRPWLWKMEPGSYVVRAVDDRGRSDAQTLRVEVSP